MYEIYCYCPTDYRSHTYYNIRDTITNTSTGCELSIPIALTVPFTVNSSKLSQKEFEAKYECTLLFTTDSLSNLRDIHPEYFI